MWTIKSFSYLLLTNGFKYEGIVNSIKMTSTFISTDIAGSVLGGGHSNENNNNNPTKLQNDIDYINTTGDTLAGDLNLKRNRLYLNNSKKQSIYKNSNDLGFETDDKFIVKNSNNTLKFYIGNDRIHYNSKRLVGVSEPTDGHDGASKAYVDRMINEQKNTATSNVEMKLMRLLTSTRNRSKISGK